jgi:hypothetical protein
VELIDAIAMPFREMDARSFLLGAVLPGTITAAGLISVALLRRAKDAPAPHWLPPLLLAIAFLPAYFLVYSVGHVSLWPADGAMRVLHAVALMGIGAAVAETLPPKWKRLRLPMLLVSCAGATSLPLLPVIDMESAQHFALALGIMLPAVVFLAFACARAHEQAPGFVQPALVGAAPFAASYVALYASIASLGQIAGGLTAAISGAAVAVLLLPKIRLRASAYLVFFTAVGLILAASRAYGYPRASIPAIALGAATPLPVVVISLLKPRKSPRWVVLGAATVLTAGLALGAIWLAYGARPQYDY